MIESTHFAPAGAVAVRQHFGGHKAVVRPVPIPNTAVKHCMADGSGCIASARVGSRQSFKKPEVSFNFGFFIFTIHSTHQSVAATVHNHGG